MDQVTAHLDRGWDLVIKGDVERAVIAAEKALEIDRNSAEALNLMGYIHAARGDAEEALEHYQKAIESDESYFDAILNAAEVLISPLGDYEQAILYCEEALDLALNPEEEAEVLLLWAEALIYTKEPDRARSLLARIDIEHIESAIHQFLYGKALYTLRSFDEAERSFERAIELNPELSDAYYHLGLSRRESDPDRWDVSLMLKTRELDLSQPMSPRTPSPEELEDACLEAIRRLPLRLRRMYRRARITVSDHPEIEDILSGLDPRTPVGFVWYRFPNLLLVREITVFVRNMDRICYSNQDMIEEIAFHLVDEARSRLTPQPQTPTVRSSDAQEILPR